MTAFIECESLSINYNIMGIATISYTVIADNVSKDTIFSSLSTAGQTYDGIVTNINSQPIPNTENAEGGPWYTTNVTLLATT